MKTHLHSVPLYIVIQHHNTLYMQICQLKPESIVSGNCDIALENKGKTADW